MDGTHFLVDFLYKGLHFIFVGDVAHVSVDVFDSGFGVGLEPPLKGGLAAAVEYNVACTGLGVCLRDAESYAM